MAAFLWHHPRHPLVLQTHSRSAQPIHPRKTPALIRRHPARTHALLAHPDSRRNVCRRHRRLVRRQRHPAMEFRLVYAPLHLVDYPCGPHRPDYPLSGLFQDITGRIPAHPVRDDECSHPALLTPVFFHGQRICRYRFHLIPHWPRRRLDRRGILYAHSDMAAPASSSPHPAKTRICRTCLHRDHRPYCPP